MSSAQSISGRKPAGLYTHTLPAHGPDPTIHLFLCASSPPYGQPLTGLSPTSSYQAYYVPPLANRPVPLQITSPPANESACAFWEIDPQLMPGLYGLQLPAALRGPGYTFVHLHFAGANPIYLQLHGLAYDPYDGFAIGLQSWVRSTCHEHLSSGLRKSMPAAIWPLLDEWFNQNGEGSYHGIDN